MLVAARNQCSFWYLLRSLSAWARCWRMSRSNLRTPPPPRLLPHPPGPAGPRGGIPPPGRHAAGRGRTASAHTRPARRPPQRRPDRGSGHRTSTGRHVRPGPRGGRTGCCRTALQDSRPPPPARSAAEAISHSRRLQASFITCPYVTRPDRWPRPRGERIWCFHPGPMQLARLVAAIRGRLGRGTRVVPVALQAPHLVPGGSGGPAAISLARAWTRLLRSSSPSGVAAAAARVRALSSSSQPPSR